MKISNEILSEEIFSRNIHLLKINKSKFDQSLVNIILTLNERSTDSIIPTVQVNNDIRKYICSLDKRIEITGLSCGHQGIENQKCFYIQFNLVVNKNKGSDDDLIYKLACYLGLKYKCQWCSYILQGKIRNIELHY